MNSTTSCHKSGNRRALNATNNSDETPNITSTNGLARKPICRSPFRDHMPKGVMASRINTNANSTITIRNAVWVLGVNANQRPKSARPGSRYRV
ncbi:hypothetical protein D3C84_728580 [compost metagenome]